MHTITKHRRYEQNTVNVPATYHGCGVAENFCQAQCGSSQLPVNRNRKNLEGRESLIAYESLERTTSYREVKEGRVVWGGTEG